MEQEKKDRIKELLKEVNRTGYSFGTNRYMCAVLDDMRNCHKTRNYGMLEGLIEEAQVKANRMEEGLDNIDDIIELDDLRRKLKAEVKALGRVLKEEVDADNI